VSTEDELVKKTEEGADMTDPIPPDNRSIDEMPFGSGAADQQTVAKAVRETLRRCGVAVAHEIEELGCTGASAKGLTPTQISELRMGLAGGGVGLPCFVPPTRYCLAHSTIGGLQVGQATRYSEEISKISRDLSPRERGHVEMVEASRRVRGGNLDERLMKTADALSGRDLPPGVERADESDTGFEDEQPYRQVVEQAPRAAAPRKPTVDSNGDLIENSFTCPEHRTPVWACRYCAAQMVVEGPLEPIYRVQAVDNEGHLNGAPRACAAKDVDDTLAGMEAAGNGRVEAYARVATFSRKLARD
jgi:hypothetical protein